ncbi:MAG: hypothetical protein JW864_16920 [Spirochaetes bacterium]|nr:hypothetical protein [Spirochaetota bacterium]
MKKLLVLIFIFSVSFSLYSQANMDGFGSVKWGNSIEEVKGGIVGKIYYTDDKKVLISKDGDIEYLYGFFYIGPYAKNAELPSEDTRENKTEQVKNSRLFYVSVKFPYLAMSDVKKKIEEIYGPATGEDMKDNKGAIVWDSEKTTVIMWVDNYEKKPFCMKINYFSKEIAKEVNDYQNVIFNSNEIEILKRLSL